MILAAGLSLATAFCTALIWAAIIVGTGYELGFAAWAVGALCGGAAAVGARDKATYLTGIIAVMCALGAILVGKATAVHIMLDRIEMPEQSLEQILEERTTDDALQFDAAYKTTEVSDAMGMAGEWPPGKNLENAETMADLPDRIRRISNEKWAKLTQEERDNRRKEVRQEITDAYRELEALKNDKFGALVSMFGLIDIVFVGLAVFTAFRLGSKPIGGSAA
jgi:hypothetical protein